MKRRRDIIASRDVICTVPPVAMRCTRGSSWQRSSVRVARREASGRGPVAAPNSHTTALPTPPFVDGRRESVNGLHTSRSCVGTIAESPGTCCAVLRRPTIVPACNAAVSRVAR